VKFVREKCSRNGDLVAREEGDAHQEGREFDVIANYSSVSSLATKLLSRSTFVGSSVPPGLQRGRN